MRRKLAPDSDNPTVAYMAQVLLNKVTELMREQGAKKRTRSLGTVSLDASVEGSGDGMMLPISTMPLPPVSSRSLST